MALCADYALAYPIRPLKPTVAKARLLDTQAARACAECLYLFTRRFEIRHFRNFSLE